MKKRFAFAMMLMLLLAAAAVVFADEPPPAAPTPPAPPAPPAATTPEQTPPASATSAKSKWTEDIMVGGYVDARPEFYWFVPGAKNLRDYHASAVSLYEAALRVTAQPAESIVKAVGTAAYRDYGRINHVTNYYLGSDRKPHAYAHSDLGDAANETLVFDEGYVQIGDDYFVRVGKYYLPISTHDPKDTFGMHYNLLQSNLITQPLAVGLGYNLVLDEHRYFAISAHAFNGQNDLVDANGHKKNDIIDTYAAALNIYPLAGLRNKTGAFVGDKYKLDLGGYFMTDATQTQGNFAKLFNGNAINYDRHVPLYGGYLMGKLLFSDTDASWLGLGFRGEYATTGQFKKHDYVIVDQATGKQTATAITFMNAELALLFFEGMVSLGGKYETVNGMDYFGTLDPDLAKAMVHGSHYTPKMYSRYGGFLRTCFMDKIAVGLEYDAGADNEKNQDRELQIQARLDF